MCACGCNIKSVEIVSVFHIFPYVFLRKDICPLLRICRGDINADYIPFFKSLNLLDSEYIARILTVKHLQKHAGMLSVLNNNCRIGQLINSVNYLLNIALGCIKEKRSPALYCGFFRQFGLQTSAADASFPNFRKLIGKINYFILASIVLLEE